ncbi:hypothetical protein A3J32_00015 [Candidatus Saccharibacteria bacterium RIFCSPLOWO2_02_FULL_46_7]|nr:MAG: hypothetical protein A3J32_00015 [Candidatus Saccharibacteria bacterium RIFCSPLOWO2_02_FULL_46_7]
MTTITTKLVKDGNSMAVRLPKTLLAMSGLSSTVELEAKKGQIIIKRQMRQPRKGWAKQIEQVVKTDPNALQPDPELSDWEASAADGLDPNEKHQSV